MCGRFSLAVSEDTIHQELPFVEVGGALRPNYNVAPTQHAYVITDEEPARLQYLTWGLVPSWSEEGHNTGRLINARAEGIETRPSFRMPIRKRRCLVLADSFYEWRTDGRNKIPYRILPRDGSLLVMAGIWDQWDRAGAYPLRSFSIITTDGNDDMAGLHNRMPVLLTNNEQRLRWLQELSIEGVLAFFGPQANKYLKSYRVSDAVNSTQNNSPELHKEVPEFLDLFSQR
jgi:putative SOS response-associated peptidase YedK